MSRPFQQQLILIFSLLVLLFLTGCGHVFEGYKGYINVQGTIYEYDEHFNQIPLEGVEVVANGKSGITDSYGHYYIKNVWVDGYLTWNAYKAGYLTEEPEKSSIYSNEDLIINKILKNIEAFSGSISGFVNVFSVNDTKIQKLNNTSSILTVPLNKNDTTAPYVEGEVLVKFKPSISTQNFKHKGKVLSQTDLTDKESIYRIKGEAGISTEELYNYYRENPVVETVSYNHILQVMKIPNDRLFSEQWHFTNIHLPAAWDITTGSSSVTVAVIDSGYLPHQDLDDNIGPGYDFVDYDYYPYDDDAYFINENNFNASHGSHIAGIIGAVTNNNEGVAGINWKVEIMPLRIISEGTADEFSLIEAINYAVNHGADVINLSLAFDNRNLDENDFPFTEEALAQAYNQGVTIVAAAGNDNTNYVYYPARSYYTIAVGASDPGNQLTSYSNYGEHLDILAPGGDIQTYGKGIISTFLTNNGTPYYVSMEGTSMAAPVVSGVAALLVSKGIRNPEEIRQILGRTSTPIFDDNLQGVGLLNADAALNSATQDSYDEHIKVYATIKEENLSETVYYILSDTASIDYEGKFYLPHVKTNEYLTIIAWKDNGDGQIGRGDYFGEAAEKIYLESGEHHRGIEIWLEYLDYSSQLQSKAVENLAVKKN